MLGTSRYLKVVVAGGRELVVALVLEYHIVDQPSMWCVTCQQSWR